MGAKRAVHGGEDSGEVRKLCFGGFVKYVYLAERLSECNCWRMIKRLGLFVLCFLASSCFAGEMEKRFDEIEAAISTEPRKAYEALSSLDSYNLRTASQRARYALLMSLACDKSYIDVTEDSLVQIAVRYYHGRRDIRHRMLSYYSLGRVQHNANNNADAIVSFLQAREWAEALADNHYLGLICRNMADLYRECNDDNMALSCYLESGKAFYKADSPYYAVYSELDAARTYMSKGMWRQADSLLAKVEGYARGRDDVLLGSVLVDQAYNLFSQRAENAEKMVALFNEARRLGHLEEGVSYLGMMAVAFDELSRKDSVSYYLSLARQKMRTPQDSIHLCNTLSVIYTNQGDFKRANEQYQKGVAIHNRLVFARENQLLANAISDFSQKEAAVKALLARSRMRLLILSSITIIALALVLFLTILLRMRKLREKDRIIREKEHIIEEDIAQIQEIAGELDSSLSARSEMARTINDLMKERVAIVKICADAYEAVMEPLRTNSRDPYRHLDEDFQNSKARKTALFLQALENFRRDETLYVVLEENVNRWRNNLMVKLRAACAEGSMQRPRFKEEDFRILLLVYSGIPDRTIAFLMNMSFSAVRTRKSREKERLLQADIPEGSYFVEEMCRTP